MRKVILDLCGGTGAWSKPYRDAGYDVRLVTLPDHDIRLFLFDDLHVRGILASPPCTMFSLSRTRPVPTETDIREALSIVDACLRLVVVFSPAWWALENPRGRLHKYLGPPSLEFDPWNYGDPYYKYTCLWGRFSLPKVNGCFPTLSRPGSCWTKEVPGSGEKRRERRSQTPAGFARAFFEANP